MSDRPTRVVIIGGGYTGLWGYRFIKRRIGHLLRRGDVQVTLISPKSYHSFHGWTAESLTGIISINNRQSPLRRILAGQSLLLANVVNIDLKAQVVAAQMISDGRIEHVPYDHLLIANGSYDNMESVPGLDAHGWTVKSPGGVLATRNQLLRLLETADSLQDGPEQDAWLTIVVAGGGFAGVEITAAVAEMLHVFKPFYGVLKRKRPRIVLVHSGAQLLPIIRPQYDRLADYCTRELEKWGVELHLGMRLSEVKAEGAVLSDGTLIPSKTVICTVGQRMTTVPGTEALPRTPNGLLLTDSTMHVQGHTNIWAGGDAARVMHVSGEPCPANALWAIMHGKWAGENIAASIAGKKLKPFTYRGLGQAASMGVGKGAAELYGFQFTGWIGWILRFFFFLYFQPSRRQAVRIFIDWLSLPFLRRYMTLSSEWQRIPETESPSAP